MLDSVTRISEHGHVILRPYEHGECDDFRVG